MRLLTLIVMLTAGSLASAARIILVPIDDRPATGQFAQMIGEMGGVTVDLPPQEILGKFGKPGDPDKVLEWLESQNLDDVIGVIVSTDMVAYGSLVASRTHETDDATAIKRIERLIQIRQRHPQTPFYAFATLTRISPTVTRATYGWYTNLIEYVQLRATPHNKGEEQKMARLLETLPPHTIEDYDAMRARNVRVNTQLIRYAAKGGFDYLLVGQDDAAIVGPQIKEAEHLRHEIAQSKAEKVVQFCEGIDQHCSVLVSKALLAYLRITPKIRVIYSDDELSHKVGLYETRPLCDTLLDQVLASGAQLSKQNEPYDYTLYVALPKTSDAKMAAFNQALEDAVSNKEKVAVANIDLVITSSVSKSLEATVSKITVAPFLLAFATWNSPSNTTGTSIPAANMTVTADRIETGKLYKERARVAFLIHRFIGDLAYHYRTRPASYKYATTIEGLNSRVEFLPEDYDKMNAFVQADLAPRAQDLFKKSFKGAPIVTPDLTQHIADIDPLTIYLPWLRAFEVRVEFTLHLN